MTRRLLGIGWLGHGNFGDEAMAYALRGALKYRGIAPPTYYTHGPLPLYRSADEAPLKAIHAGERPKYLQRLGDTWRLRPYGALVVGGGSILHSATSIRWKLDVIERLKRRHDRAFRVVSVGVSLGPLPDQEAERLCTAYLAKNDLIVVRDEASARIAARLCPRAEIRSSRDLSLVLPRVNPEAWNTATAGPRAQGTIAASFVRRDDRHAVRREDPDVRRYLAIIDRLIQEGWTVRLCTLYTGPGHRDAELHRLLQNAAMRPERVEHHVFDGDIYGTIAALHGCGAALSMRLHGIIFAYLLDIPFVSLASHRKHADFCETIGYPVELLLHPEKIDAETVADTLRSIADRSKDPFAQTEPPTRGAARVEAHLDAVAKLLAAPV